MSHCAPEATLKPKRFEFTLKTVITDVFVAQVYWEAVPKTWPGGSKASIAKCVVRPWNSTRSVGGRVDVLDLLKPSVCRQPSTEVPGRTKTSKRYMCRICRGELQNLADWPAEFGGKICSGKLWWQKILHIWPDSGGRRKLIAMCWKFVTVSCGI